MDSGDCQGARRRPASGGTSQDCSVLSEYVCVEGGCEGGGCSYRLLFRTISGPPTPGQKMPPLSFRLAESFLENTTFPLSLSVE